MIKKDGIATQIMVLVRRLQAEDTRDGLAYPTKSTMHLPFDEAGSTPAMNTFFSSKNNSLRDRMKARRVPNTSFPYLPAEILLLILSYIPFSDWVNVRRVIRLFEEASAKQLFECIRFHANHKSLDGVHAVVSDDRKRRMVKTIIWDTNLYDLRVNDLSEWLILVKNFRHVNLDELHSEVRASFDLGRKGHKEDLESSIQLALKEEYVRYKDSVARERSVFRSRMLVAKLRSLLGRFPNLQRVVLANDEHAYPGTFLGGTAYRFASRSYLGDYCYSGLARKDTLRRHSHSLWNEMEDIRPLQLALRAIPATVQQIEAKTISWQGLIRSSLKSFNSKDLLQITTLDLTFPIIGQRSGTVRECRSSLQAGHFKTFLLGCANLHTLALNFEKRDLDMRFGPSGKVEKFPSIAAALLEDVLPQHQAWRHLTHLILRHMDTSPNHFIELLQSCVIASISNA